MKWSNRISIYLFIVIFLAFQTSCEKFLDKKPIKAQSGLDELTDLQAALDFYFTMNQGYPGLLEVVADDYYLSTAKWAAVNQDDQLNYIWDKNATCNRLWYQAYQIVYTANTVLTGLNAIQQDGLNKLEYDNVKGQALFYRSLAFYHIAQLWCKPYTSSAASDLGIPLRTSIDINIPSVRSTVQETYDHIINDFKEAIALLPVQAVSISRPKKAAAYGALARTYLSMRDYGNAGLYADSSLQLYNTLMDYNSLNPSLAAPINRNNSESLFYGTLQRVGVPTTASTAVDTLLYQSYGGNDLRKTICYFQNGTIQCYKGSYGGACFQQLGCTDDQYPYCGIATNEMYLIRAESAARAGLKDAALSDLNLLLQTRWRTGTFVPYTAASATGALMLIKQERRKELMFRGLRWADLRRYNLEGDNITLTRIINSTTYILPPNDLRWVMLIPFEAINLSGMQQNPR